MAGYVTVGVWGIAIVLIVVPVLLPQLLSLKCMIDILGRELDAVIAILMKMCEHEVGGRIQNPSTVYTLCMHPIKKELKVRTRFLTGPYVRLALKGET